MVVLAAGVVTLQAVHDRAGGPPASASVSLLYVRSPEALKRLALSYDAVLADLYWIRAVQHFGSTRLSGDSDKRYDLLYPLLDLSTSLDPYLNIAYYYGSTFLAEPPPGGPGRPDLAIALLQKGLQAQPDKWEFAQWIGFVHYWWRHDYQEAAAWFERAADFPDAPIWMAPLAATTLAQGGNRASSRQLWRHVVDTAEDEWFRNEARRRLLQLDAMDRIDRLQQAVDAVAASLGRPPRDWTDLRGAGLRGVPVDPTGVPHRLTGGRVGLDPRSRLNPLPTEPARLR